MYGLIIINYYFVINIKIDMSGIGKNQGLAKVRNIFRAYLLISFYILECRIGDQFGHLSLIIE